MEPKIPPTIPVSTAIPLAPLIALMGLTSSVFLFIGQAMRSQLTILDVPTILAPITRSEYADRHVPTVRAGLYIQEFSKFNMLAGSFTASGVAWFQFDPELVTLDTIAEFSFEKGTILYKSKPITQLRDGQLFARFDIRVEFQNNFNYRLFPFDDHRIELVLINKYLTLNDAIYIADDTDVFVASDMEGQGWAMDRTQVAFGYQQELFDTSDRTKSALYPAVAYDIYFRRNSARLAFIIFFPMLLLFFLMCMPFTLDDKGDQLPLSLATITGLLSFRFVIDTISPQAGYFMLSDYFFLIFMLILFIFFLCYTLGSELSARARWIIISSAHGLVIASCFAMLIVEFYV